MMCKTVGEVTAKTRSSFLQLGAIFCTYSKVRRYLLYRSKQLYNPQHAPDVYGPYVTVGKKGEKQLLIQCLTALYGTMVASLLYYKKFVKSLKLKGFKLNPYDPCVANKQVKGEQLTVCFHVDDCKISHLSPKVVDKTIEWLRLEYEHVFEDGTGLMKVHRGKTHKYLGMTLDISHHNQCRVTMIDYVDVLRRSPDGLLVDSQESLPGEDRPR
jgi:hypothetical protein